MSDDNNRPSDRPYHDLAKQAIREGWTDEKLEKRMNDVDNAYSGKRDNRLSLVVILAFIAILLVVGICIAVN